MEGKQQQREKREVKKGNERKMRYREMLASYDRHEKKKTRL